MGKSRKRYVRDGDVPPSAKVRETDDRGLSEYSEILIPTIQDLQFSSTEMTIAYVFRH